MNLVTWKRYSERPLIVASIAFLVTYAWQVIANLDGSANTVANAIIGATWVIFVIDYVITLALAKNRWHWFYTHLFDLAVVALPMLRPLRLLRVITLLSVLQRTAGSAIRGNVMIYVAAATVLLVFTASLALLDAERGYPGAAINSFGDAIWWSIVTLTTVGYGDLYPVSPIGRMLAAGVMIGGIALIGLVTATLASWIVDRVADRDGEEQAATRRQVNELAREVVLLREAIAKER